MVELVELDEPSSRLVLVVESMLVLVDDRSTIVTSVEEPTVVSVDRSSMLVGVVPLVEGRLSIVPPDAVACVADEDTSELTDAAIDSDPESFPASSLDAHATPTSSPAAATAVTTPISFLNIVRPPWLITDPSVREAASCPHQRFFKKRSRI
jgi:hypothetical protein